MPEHEIVVECDPAFAAEVPVSVLVRAARNALESGGVRVPVEVAISIVDAVEIQRLNREYRGIDAPTDVLSFAQREADQFPVVPDTLEPLGDVVIAFPIAAAHAVASGKSVQRELAVLAAHGVLHLLGFDHAEPEEERVMFALQDEVLARLGLP